MKRLLYLLLLAILVVLVPATSVVMTKPASAVTVNDRNCVIAGGTAGNCFYNPNEQCATTDSIYEEEQPAPGKLTKAEKIAQTFTVGFDASTPKGTIESLFKKYKLGGIYLVGTSNARAAGFGDNFYNSLEKATGLPVVVASDEEGGAVKRYTYPGISGGLPSAKSMGSMSDGKVKELGEKVGKQLSEDGVTTDLAPVLDIDDNRNIISQKDRAFSSDEEVVARKAGAFAKGLEAKGVKPVFKHVPGFGGAGSGNTDLEPVTAPSSYTLAKNIAPYRDLLKDHPEAGVMLSNIFVPDLGRSKPISLNSKAVDYLRKDLSFTGLITTDDLSALGKYGDKAVGLSGAISGSLRAGVDMPLFGIGTTSQAEAEKKLDAAIKVAKNTVLSEDLDRALSKVNKFKGLTDSTPSTGQENKKAGCCSLTSNETSADLSGKNRVEQTFNFLRNELGLTPIQAAAVVGNLQQESGAGLNPTAVNPDSGAYGIAQWYRGRFTNLKTFAQQKGGSHSDFKIQLLFLQHELNGSEKAAFQSLKRQTNLEAAAADFEIKFERANHGIPQRQAYARKVLQEYGGGLLPTNLDLVGPGSAAICANQESGTSGEAFVLGEYAWPVDISRPKTNSGYPWPCKGSCHHDRSPAFDLSTTKAIKGQDDDVVGRDIYAITDGTVTNLHIYNGIPGCYSFQFKGKDGWQYYYTHMRKPAEQNGAKVKVGTKLAEVGERKCTGNGSYPHLHIDRGSPKGQPGGYTNSRDDGLVDLMNKLYSNLPENKP